jgi:adenylosuccinate synthase
VLHLIPSGILHGDKKCVMGNGLVVDIEAFLEELGGLQERGINAEGRLFLSARAHAVFPFHRALDAACEGVLAEGHKIGTTRRGIGPAYQDKMARTGLRMCDLAAPDFAERLQYIAQEKNRLLRYMGAAPLDLKETVNRAVANAQQVKPYIADTTLLLEQAMQQGKNLLFEGAQGTMLDIDHGTYPFVTSSNTCAGGAATGCGVPPGRIDRVLGVIKAYTTRVGEGPFPTELHDSDGDGLRDRGHEYGATTGRPRRCGWFDAVVARYAVMVNGIDEWAVTKLDVLDECATIKLCIAYEFEGERLEHMPPDTRVTAHCRPVYEEMPGWRCSTRNIDTFNDMPDAAKNYLARLEKLTGVPIRLLSTGPARRSTLHVE